MQIKRSPYYNSKPAKKSRRKQTKATKAYRRKKRGKKHAIGTTSVMTNRFVDQQVVSPKKGDCMRAAIASLLEMPLHEVPDFANVDPEDKWYGYKGLFDFMLLHGYDCDYLWNPDFKKANKEEMVNWDMKARLKKNGGIKGLFYATVASPTFKRGDVTHAVLVDDRMKIVHDPNPNKKALKIKRPELEVQLVLLTFPIPEDDERLD